MNAKQKAYKEIYVKLLQKYGDDPYYRDVLYEIPKRNKASMGKAIKALVAVRGEQAFKILMADVKKMTNEIG